MLIIIYFIDEILDELARETSPDQAPNPSLLNIQPSLSVSQGITHPDDQSVQQVMPCLTLYFSKFTQSANTSFLLFSFRRTSLNRPPATPSLLRTTSLRKVKRLLLNKPYRWKIRLG